MISGGTSGVEVSSESLVTLQPSSYRLLDQEKVYWIEESLPVRHCDLKEPWTLKLVIGDVYQLIVTGVDVYASKCGFRQRNDEIHVCHIEPAIGWAFGGNEMTFVIELEHALVIDNHRNQAPLSLRSISDNASDGEVRRYLRGVDKLQRMRLAVQMEVKYVDVNSEQCTRVQQVKFWRSTRPGGDHRNRLTSRKNKFEARRARINSDDDDDDDDNDDDSLSGSGSSEGTSSPPSAQVAVELEGLQPPPPLPQPPIILPLLLQPPPPVTQLPSPPPVLAALSEPSHATSPLPPLSMHLEVMRAVNDDGDDVEFEIDLP